MLMGDSARLACRGPAIIADAAYEIFNTNPSELTGQALVDEPFLKTRGYKDFQKYSIDPKNEPALDLFVED